MKLEITKPITAREVITYRKTRSINIDSFREDVSQCGVVQSASEDLCQLVKDFDSDLRCILDQHAPLKQNMVTIRPNTGWYNDDIRREKHVKRQLERHWRQSGLSHDRLLYVDQCRKVDSMCDDAYVKHIQTHISDNSKNTKELFNITKKLTMRNATQKLPAHDTLEELTETFADYFHDKVQRIRSNLEELRGQSTILPDTECPNTFLEFSETTEEEVKKIITESASKSCELDPIPTWLLKQCLDHLLPVITKIVNLSLSSGHLPDDLKNAILRPLIKKALLDSNVLKNFRPVSNLTFISKVIEKVVAVQLKQHFHTNCLNDILQSAYKEMHSTETALLKVQNDILCALDDGCCVLLIMLDLSAAFDTVDHTVLLSRLSTRFGVKGVALSWIESYLTDRSQCVSINGVTSAKRKLTCGVPQGSVLGPLLFSAYTSPLGDIVRKYGLSYHIYADDKQLYIAFKPLKEIMAKSVEVSENCVSEVRAWFSHNFLQLNDDKTIIMLFGSQYRKLPALPSVQGQCSSSFIKDC